MFSPDLKAALTSARDEAARLRHESIQPLHLALGALSAPHPDLSALLPDSVRAEMRDALVAGITDGVDRGQWKFDLPYSDEAKAALEVAHLEAKACAHAPVSSSHLLCAVLVNDRDIRRTLGVHGVSPEAVRAALRAAPSSGAA